MTLTCIYEQVRILVKYDKGSNLRLKDFLNEVFEVISNNPQATRVVRKGAYAEMFSV